METENQKKEMRKSTKLLLICLILFGIDTLLYFTVAQKMNTYDTFLGETFRVMFILFLIALVLCIVVRVLENKISSKSEKEKEPISK